MDDLLKFLQNAHGATFWEPSERDPTRYQETGEPQVTNGVELLTLEQLMQRSSQAGFRRCFTDDYGD